MSVRELFEQKFSATVETCADDVLEIFDYLLDRCDELEEARDTQRKRISALERENNILRCFLSDAEGVDRNADDLDDMIGSLDAVIAKLDSIASIRDSLLDLSASAKDLYASAEQFSKIRSDCEQSLSVEAIPTEDEDTFDEEPDSSEEAEVAVVSEEPAVKVTDSEETEELDDASIIPAEEASEEKNSTVSSDDEAGDIASRLKSMLEADVENEADTKLAKKEVADDDFSEMIFKFFSEADDLASTAKKAESAEAPVILIDGEGGAKTSDVKTEAPIIKNETEIPSVAPQSFTPSKPHAVTDAKTVKTSDTISASKAKNTSDSASAEKSELQSIKDSLAKIRNKRTSK